MDTETVARAVKIRNLPDTQAPAVNLPILDVTDRSLFNAGGAVDGPTPTQATHIFYAYSDLRGNDSSFNIMVDDAVTGRHLAPYRVLPPANFKIDSAAFFQAGTSLVVVLTCHEISSSPTRHNILAVAILTNAATAYASPGLGAAAPALSSGSPVPDPGPAYTLEQIGSAVLAALVNGLNGDFGAKIQHRALDAIREAGLPDPVLPGFLQAPDNLLHVLQDGMYQWTKDRNYEAAMEAIRQSPGFGGGNTKEA